MNNMNWVLWLIQHQVLSCIFTVLGVALICFLLPVELFTFLNPEPERSRLTLEARERKRRVFAWLRLTRRRGV